MPFSLSSSKEATKIKLSSSLLAKDFMTASPAWYNSYANSLNVNHSIGCDSLSSQSLTKYFSYNSLAIISQKANNNCSCNLSIFIVFVCKVGDSFNASYHPASTESPLVCLSGYPSVEASAISSKTLVSVPSLSIVIWYSPSLETLSKISFGLYLLNRSASFPRSTPYFRLLL